MSLYSKTAQIDGLTFGLVMRGAANGCYIIVFERDAATLEQIEAVNWASPTITGDTILPKEYGYELTGITYSSSDHSYRVTVRVARQYLGDVTAYQEQITELQADKTALAQESASRQAQITELEGQLAEADEALIALYEQQSAPAEPDAEENTETAAEALGEEETA